MFDSLTDRQLETLYRKLKRGSVSLLPVIDTTSRLYGAYEKEPIWQAYYNSKNTYWDSAEILSDITELQDKRAASKHNPTH